MKNVLALAVLMVVTGEAIAEEALLDTTSAILTPAQLESGVTPPAPVVVNQRQQAAPKNQSRPAPRATGRQQLQADNPLSYQPVPGSKVEEMVQAGVNVPAVLPTPTPVPGVKIEQVAREVKRIEKTTSKTLPGLSPGKAIQPLVVTIQPGVTEVIKVARDFPSLLATPFSTPQVVDGGRVELIYAGSNVYVKPKGTEPEALFISEKDGNGTVVSLMIVPENIPAQQITIQVEGLASANQAIGDQREKRDDYVSGLVELMRSVAGNKSPYGYSESRVLDVEAVLGDIVATPDRRFSGSNRDIYRYLLKNKGREALTLSEPSFYSKGVRAVSLVPKIRLAPGDSTFLYILKDKSVDEVVK